MHRFVFFAALAFCCALEARAQQSSTLQGRIDSLNQAFEQKDKTDVLEAEKIAQEALALAISTGYSQGEADARSNLGRTYLRQGDNKKAIEHLFAALKFYETQKEYQNTLKYGTTLTRLAGAFYFERDFERSLHYARKAFSIAQRNSYHDLSGLTSRVIGEGFRDQGKFDSALYYFNHALESFTRTNNLIHLANINIDMGLVYYYQSDYRQAIAYTRKFLELAKQQGLKTDYSIGLHNIGEFHYLLKSYRESLQYLDSAQHYGESFAQYSVLFDTYQVKAKVYKELKNPDSVAHYYQKAMAIKDSILNENYKKELASLQTQMDVYRHEAENKILQKEKSIANLYRNLAMAGFVAIISVLGFVLARQRLRVQNGVKLRLEGEVAQRTAEIVAQNAVIEQVNLKLQLSLNRAKVDPHFIFNVLNSIQHLVLEKKPAEASDHLARLSRLTRYVLEKSSLDEVTLKEELAMLEQYIRLEQLRLDHKFGYEIVRDIESDIMLPAMLIQPYVENAIVHGLTPASGEGLLLRLIFSESEGMLRITVTDNGVGRDPSKVRKGHQSMGSKLGHERLAILSRLEHGHYHMKIEDADAGNPGSAGTTVVLEIPLKVRQSA